MLRSQPELLLKTMSGSMATQWQVLMSMVLLPLENMGKSLVGAAYGDHMDVQGLPRTSPTPHHWLHLQPEAALTEQTMYLTQASVELALVAGMWVSSTPE